MKVSNRACVALVLGAMALWACEAEERHLGGEAIDAGQTADDGETDDESDSGASSGDASVGGDDEPVSRDDSDDPVASDDSDDSDQGTDDAGTSTDDADDPDETDDPDGPTETDDPMETDDPVTTDDADDAPDPDAGPPETPECERDSDCDDGNLCNGDELCIEAECHAATRIDDGTVCTIEGRDDWLHCVAGNCIPSVCGDGLVDARTDEQCDDGNANDGDGCEVGCTWSCSAAEHCDDGNLCNGTESCNTDVHVCQPGQPADDQTACGSELECNDGRCLPVGCGDGTLSSSEQCDDGNLDDGDGCDSDCTYSCSADVECDDGSVCTGAESCDLSTHTCVAGQGMDCDDGNACTDNACDPAAGCYYPLIDVDGDGHAASALGSCGDDCNDDDPKVYAGAAELCDGIDNDCNGTKDDNSPIWYPDCDGDGFAEAGAAGVQQCDKPAAAPAGCDRGLVGAWTEVKPTGGYDDCYDSNAEARPRLTQIDNDAAWKTSGDLTRPTGARFDFNCDDAEERRYTAVNMDPNSGCGIVILPPVIGPVTSLLPAGLLVDPIVLDEQDCLGSRGWTGTTAPVCGTSAQFTYCSKYGSSGSCARRTKSWTQECR